MLRKSLASVAVHKAARPKTLTGQSEQKQLQAECVRVLRLLLPPKAAALYFSRDVQEPGGRIGIPFVFLMHEGKTFAIEARVTGLTIEQHATQARLRNAGIRVEVAHSPEEFLRHLYEFGIALKPHFKFAGKIQAAA